MGFELLIPDAFSALSLDDPCIGDDVFGPESGCGRNIATATYRWKAGGSDDPHTEGLAFAGAFWKIHSGLKQMYDVHESFYISKSLFLKALMLIAEHRTGLNPEITGEVLLADSLVFGGLHHELIVESFAAHGL